MGIALVLGVFSCAQQQAGDGDLDDAGELPPQEDTGVALPKEDTGIAPMEDTGSAPDEDAGTPPFDNGELVDDSGTGPVDTGNPGPVDTGNPPPFDSGTFPVDTGPRDTGVVVPVDTGPRDTGVVTPVDTGVTTPPGRTITCAGLPPRTCSSDGSLAPCCIYLGPVPVSCGCAVPIFGCLPCN